MNTRWIMFLAIATATVPAAVRADALDIIPRPKLIETRPGSFTLPHAPTVAADSSSNDTAQWLIKQIGGGLSQTPANSDNAGQIRFTSLNADPSLGDEGYTLDVDEKGVVVRAAKPAGMFYGAVTLLQMLPPATLKTHVLDNAGVQLPAVHIVDQPRFQWRGLSFDVARHFETKESVHRLLDEMAMHKLNVLHWHLTDDQGWRIEIKKYPKLTSVGAWRDSAGFGLDPKFSTTYGPDGKYGGFYTQDEIKAVVAHASALHIVVVPEIEMPGHATAALRAYPEFGVPAAASTDVKGDAGIFNGVYEPANEQTFTFLQDVLSEVIDLFPSPFIHIGGDEVPKGPWQNNPPDVAFMKAHGIEGPDQLQSYFVQRIGKFIESKGRRMIGWDEILEGGLAPDATVMSWRGTEGGKAAARAGHDVVMTPNPYTYLDGEQSGSQGAEPHTRGAVLPIRKVYSYEPVPAGMPADQVHHVLGTQGCLWTEYVPNFPWAEYLIWPREAALAEVAWTPAADRNWEDFSRRLPTEQLRLDAMGVNYRPTINDTLTHQIHLSDGQITIDPLPGAVTRFTMDADYPMPDSPEYTKPVALPGGWVQVAARYFWPDKLASAATAATFLDGRAVTVSATSVMDWDARKTCFYTQRWGGGPGDNVTVTFDNGPEKLQEINITSGINDPKTALTHAVLETSVDGKEFTSATPFKPDGSARVDVGGASIVAFRIRFTAMQTPHPIIQTVTLH